jgi:SAM-dependent methyltransferase
VCGCPSFEGLHVSEPQIDPDAFRAFERAAHDETAEGYRDFFTTVTGYAIEPLLDASGVCAGSRVLDVATGPGMLARGAAIRGASRVVGVDLAPRMIEISAAAHPGIEFRLGDAEALPFEDDSFDVVLCSFGVGHFPRPELALSEFARVSVPGGTVAVSWWDIPARHRLNGIFFDAFSEAKAVFPPDVPAGPPVFRFSDDQALSDLLRSAALVGVTVQTFSFEHRLPSADALWNGILNGTVRTAIGIRRQPDDVRARIRAVYDRLLKPYMTGNGVRIPIAFKIGVGRKRSTISTNDKGEGV